MSAASRIVPAVPADLGALEAAYARIAAPPGAAEKTLLKPLPASRRGRPEAGAPTSARR